MQLAKILRLKRFIKSTKNILEVVNICLLKQVTILFVNLLKYDLSLTIQDGTKDDYLRDILVSIHERGVLLVLFAYFYTVCHVLDPLPLEESELPQDETDDDHNQEAGHDADHHDPHGDVGHPGLRQPVGVSDDADGGLVVAPQLLGLHVGGHFQPGPGVDDHAVNVGVVLHQGGVPNSRS